MTRDDCNACKRTTSARFLPRTCPAARRRRKAIVLRFASSKAPPTPAIRCPAADRTGVGRSRRLQEGQGSPKSTWPGLTRNGNAFPLHGFAPAKKSR